jgi:hypothetical protein
VVRFAEAERFVIAVEFVEAENRQGRRRPRPEA